MDLLGSILWRPQLGLAANLQVLWWRPHCRGLASAAKWTPSAGQALVTAALADYTSDPSRFGKIIEQLAKTITVQSEVPLVLE